MPQSQRVRAQSRRAQPVVTELLERRQLLSATVVGRWTYYGNSVFDHGGFHGSAVPTDKVPLFPGQWASFSNYTSYSKGINAIVVDIQGWDFSTIPMSFRVGRSTDTSTWSPAPQPLSITRYPGKGVQGSTRMAVVWADYSIRDEWLQVTTGGPGTLLPTADVFYFGNQVGCSGNSITDASVNAADEFGARFDSHTFLNPAPITNIHDYNRDGKVDAVDQMIARNNQVSADNAIQLFGVNRTPGTGWDFDSFLRNVKPLQNGLQGHQPLTWWSLPWPSADKSLLLQDNSLRGVLQAYLDRGFVPPLYAGDTTSSDMIAMGKALNQAGLPVTVLVPRNDVLATTYQNASVWVSGPDWSLGGAVRQWPSFPLATPSLGAAYVAGILKPLKDAGINVDRVIFDDESLPNPWNGAWDVQRSSPLSVACYPSGTLSNELAFQKYVLNLRTQLEQQVMVSPVHSLWPNAYVGNFNESDSSTANPYFLSTGAPIPARQLGPGTLSLPEIYGSLSDLARYTQTNTQANADNYYLRYLLRTFSSSSVNRQPGTIEIPFVNQMDTADVNLPASQEFGMSTARYQELLRHIWMRGADSQVVFTYTQSAPQALSEVEAARSIFDELLGFGDFLNKGQPMNLTNPTVGSTGPIWSGLKLGTQCLIRTFTDAATAGSVTLTAFPGVTVTLPAPTTGATFIVNSDGTFRRVDTASAAATAASSALAPVVTRALAVTAQTSTTPSASSQFWQDWENRKQALATKSTRRVSATFSTTPIPG